VTLKADWKTAGEPIDPDTTEKLFFDDHEWATIEAAAARIIPTDHDPGAREARVIVFIDRYLSGIDYIYASADGGGFLQLTGKLADAWRTRIGDMQRTYRAGIRELDEVAQSNGGVPFCELPEDRQDNVLELFSGAPKPAKITLGSSEAVGSFLQGVFDEGMEFWPALCLHVRQGFFCDPVYGGNKNRMGWEVVGFDGPQSLRDTMDGTYSTDKYFVQNYDWSELVPQLREQTQFELPAPVTRNSGS